MESRADLWVIVLAGGDGRRIRSLSRDALGRRAPKQFCRFGGDRSLLRRTLERAGRLARPEQIVAVVSDSQRRWWEIELADLPRRNVLSQPVNRGTAIAILHAASEISRRSPGAMVLVLPSDQEAVHEHVLLEGLRRTVEAARPGLRLVLAGMETEEVDADYGWIVPAPGEASRPRGVVAFVEKPEPDVAVRLARSGALVSSFMFASTVHLLLDLYEWTQPDLLRGFADHAGPLALPGSRRSAAYERIPVLDFSRDLLERSTWRLSVLAVPYCGWTDLGTPSRLQRWMEQQSIALAEAG